MCVQDTTVPLPPFAAIFNDVHKQNSALGWVAGGFNLFFSFIFHLVGTNKAIMQNLSFPEGVILTISVGWVVGGGWEEK